MDAAARRLTIARKSPLSQQLDPRPRCEECHRVLTHRDHVAYWDGADSHVKGCIPRGDSVVPRVCENCAEDMGCKSV